MNEMTLLRDLGTALDGDATLPPARVRQRVDAVVHGRRPVRTPAMRRGWRLAGAGGLAMVAVTRLLALQTVGVGDHHHRPPRRRPTCSTGPRWRRRPHRPWWPVRTSSCSPRRCRQSSARTPTRSPGHRRRPSSSGRRWNRRRTPVCSTESGGRSTAPATGCSALSRTRSASATTSCTAVVRAANASIRTARRRARWPATGPCVTPHRAYQDDLPTDPAAMRRYLYDTYGGSRPDQNVFLEIAYLNTEVYVPPAARAALFEVAAGIPGVRLTVDGPTRPVGAGSRPPGISTKARRTAWPIWRSSCCSTRTARYLGDRNVIIRDGWGKPLDQPVLVSSTALLRVAIVDQAGQLP